MSKLVAGGGSCIVLDVVGGGTGVLKVNFAEGICCQSLTAGSSLNKLS